MMNLDKILSEGDISNFDQMNDGEIYSASQFSLEDTKQVSANNKSNKEIIAKQNKELCVKVAKTLQNKGKTAREIKSYLDERFPKEFIPECLEDDLNKEEGVFGVVLVDCSSFDSKNDYDKLPPSIKHNHQYAIKCGCSNRYVFKESKSSKISGDINAFISEQDDFSEMPIATEICPKTGLPVLNKVKDYKEEDAIKFLNDLEEKREITSFEKKEIIAKSSSPLNSVKRAFNLIHKKAFKETNKVVDNFNKYSLGKNNTNVKISKKSQESLKVSNLSTAPIKAEVEENQNNNIMIDVPGGKEIPIAVGVPAEKALNINNFQEPKMNLNNTELKKDIPVDVKNDINIPVVIEKEVEIVPDIERGEIVDEEWFVVQDDSQQDIDIDENSQTFDIDGSSKLLI